MKISESRPRVHFLLVMLWAMVCVMLAGCGKIRNEPVVSELHFELNLGRPGDNGAMVCSMGDRSKPVREYFSNKELHSELGEILGRTSEDIGESLSVVAMEDSDARFILRALGKDHDEASELVNEAFSRYQEHLIEAQQRYREQTAAHLEKQIELQKIKVAEAKAKMDEARQRMDNADDEAKLD